MQDHGGGHEGELDIVGFKPEDQSGPAVLLHVEALMDADSCAEREARFSKKFASGEKYICDLFKGLASPDTPIHKVAILGLASRVTHESLGGARVVLLGDLLAEILAALKERSWWSESIPEGYPILRTLQVVAAYSHRLMGVLGSDSNDRRGSPK